MEKREVTLNLYTLTPIRSIGLGDIEIWRRMLVKKKARKGEWAKHLRPFGKKTANKKHRKMNKAVAKEG